MRCEKLRGLFLAVGLSIVFFSVVGQDLQLKYTEFEDGKLVVHYALHDSVAGRFYTVRLYSSKDNFLNPLEKVSEDVGIEVKPSRDNKIIWDMRAELGESFVGKVSLEVRGRIFVPFINTAGINHYKVFKRKRKYNITWSGGTPQNILNFDLYNGGEKIHTYPHIANVGSYSFEFPGYIKPGKNYRFRISDSKNGEEVVHTERFRIKRRAPLVLKALPILAVGYFAYFIIGKQAETNDEIGMPPIPFK